MTTTQTSTPADPFALINRGGADDLGVEHVTLTDDEAAFLTDARRRADERLAAAAAATGTYAEAQCEVCDGPHTLGLYSSGGCDDLDCDSHLN